MSSPKLRKLKLHRFRSFEKDVVEFDNPTFLVGQNGSGKSNFADAFAFLAEAMSSPLQAVLEHRGGFPAVGHRSSARGRPSNLGLAVTIDNLDSDTVLADYAFELRALRGSYGFEVVRERCTLERTDGQIDLFDRHLLPKESKMSRLTLGDVSDLVMDRSALALPIVGGDARFKSISRFLSEMRVCRIEPTALRGMQDPDGGLRLHSDGSNAASVLREIQRESPDDWELIREILESIVPGTIGVQPKKHGNKLTLEFKQDWAKKEPVRFEAFNMSDGTLRILGLLTAVFQPQKPSLLVIEEPEATMHQGALDSILDVLRHAARFMQVVVTTHSPDVLDAKWIEDRHLRIATWSKGVTRVNVISQASRQALCDHLMGAGELLRSNALTPMSEDLFDDEIKYQYELFPEGNAH